MLKQPLKSQAVCVLITLALILWGWQNNILFPGIIMSALLLSAYWIQWRLEVSNKNFNYIADLTSVLFFMFIVFQFSTKSAQGIFGILAALPYLFFPLILVQHFSHAGDVPLHSLFMSLRKQAKTAIEIQRINLDYPYLLVVLISSSAGNKQSDLFFICISLLGLAALYSIRPRRIRIYSWLPLVILSIVMGYALQNGLKIAQSRFEMMASTFLEQMMWRNRNPDKTRTAFGYIGKLKLSDEIHVRLKTDEPVNTPVLLREASYTDFRFGLWINEDSGFEAVDPTLTKEWIFDPDKTDQNESAEKKSKLHKYTISTFFKGDRAVIPLPHGTVKINNVAATEAELNQYGAVNLGVKPGWVRYDAYFDKNVLGSAPGDIDLSIHKNYQAVLIKLADELDLHSKTPKEIVHTIETFFKNNFTYSLTQYRRMKGKNRLDDFLYQRREGHCEYFATATTLLLRAAGIPARYSVGYSVQEFSPFEGQYLARARDAHSWTIAYVDNEWIVIDNTPALWVPLEAEDENWWQVIPDLWSWLSYSVSTWKDNSENPNTLAIQGLLLIVIIYFFWRLFTDSRFIKIRQNKQTQKISRNAHGLDSPLYKLITSLEGSAQQGENQHKRHPGETLTGWFSRQQLLDVQQMLMPLLDLHYRYRFDPAGLTADERNMFEKQVNEIISKTNHKK